MANKFYEAFVALIFVVGLVVTSACAAPTYYIADVPEDEAVVEVEWLDARFREDGFSVRVKFSENFSYFEGVIQEIEFDPDGDGDVDYVLVEYFKLTSGRMVFSYDHHSGSDAHRRMTVYPANVRGVDYMYGSFAHLPQNMDGSRVTYIPETLNMTYTSSHDTIGEITAHARDRAVVWEIYWDRGSNQLEVVLPKE